MFSIQDPVARGNLLYKLADLIERDRAYIAALETFNNGKPFKDSYNIDIPHCISILRYNHHLAFSVY
jgi:acyl-CoA reductase-like NAD-dependent aldehyde dehydrogenase